ncbi:MAG TPA: SDR family oxidoreductase [Longimicrobiales bacterium]|nr:SDR family oxidoreductase [Longimicrobiales bacterium]
MELNGKTALVTGGAHRLGRAFALGLARAGADVLIDYHASEEEAGETVAQISALGREAEAIRADISDGADVKRLVAACADRFGRLDVLVNSASLFHSAPVESTTDADWDRSLDVNLKGPFMLSRDATPLLRRDGGGVIVNIADLSAFQAWPSYVAHAVSKAGLVHLTRVLARALAPDIRVNCVAPGTVLPPTGYTDAESDPRGARRVIGREGTPEDAVRALLYFVEADFVTGEIAVVDGGRMLL